MRQVLAAPHARGAGDPGAVTRARAHHDEEEEGCAGTGQRQGHLDCNVRATERHTLTDHRGLRPDSRAEHDAAMDARRANHTTTCPCRGHVSHLSMIIYCFLPAGGRRAHDGASTPSHDPDATDEGVDAEDDSGEMLCKAQEETAPRDGDCTHSCVKIASTLR